MAYDILIVDDELDIARLVAESLEDEGYTARCACDAISTFEAVSLRRPSLVILDIWLGDSRFDGIKILEELKADHRDLPVIMMSGHGTIETAVSAIKKGAYDFIEKPFKMDRLLLVVQRALETARLRRENENLKRQTVLKEGFIESALIPPSVHQIIERVACTNSRVLIEGPTGSGKELTARLLHRRSLRKEGPFTVVSCEILKGDELEMELFGSETVPGRMVGALEASHHGTLVLDEVAVLPLSLQGKLVRFLQETSFTRQGGHKKVQVDVRVLATTTRPLLPLIEKGQFREDFFYRLNVVPIRLLPLQERLMDFEKIIETLTVVCCKAQGVPLKTFSSDALLALKAHHWPGNLAQLKNVVEWAIVMAKPETDEALITADMLPAEILLRAPTILQKDQASEIMMLPLREARELFEREYLLAQVSKFSGNISHTAQFVGMERSALHRKLKNLKIER